MARATTAAYAEHVLEVSENGTSWSRLCGLMNFSNTFAAVTSQDQVPDCDDESLPHAISREVQSVDLTVDCEAIWAQESHETILQWMLTGALKHARVGYLAAAIGDVEYVSGQAIMANLQHRREKGVRVKGTFQLQFSGALTTTDQTT